MLRSIAFVLLLVMGRASYALDAAPPYLLCKTASENCTYYCPFNQSLFDGTATCTLTAGTCQNPTLPLSGLVQIPQTARGFIANFGDGTQSMLCQWKGYYAYGKHYESQESIQHRYHRFFNGR